MTNRLTIILLAILPAFSYAQDESSLYEKAFDLPDKFFNTVEKKCQKFQQDAIRSTTKYLNRLERQELRIQQKLRKTDSLAAKEIFGDINKRYDDLRSQLKDPTGKLQQSYSPYMDSIKTSLKFLSGTNIPAQWQEKFGGVFKDYNGVQEKLNYTGFISKQLKQRQELLNNKLQSIKLGKYFTRFKRDVYYYRAQVDEYKRILESPGQLEKALLGAVNKIPAFRGFFAKYSQLGSLFQLPGNIEINTTALNSMQTREVLMQELGQRLGAGTNTQNAVASSLSAAQSSLQSLKNKLKQGSNTGDDLGILGFKPNPEKTKSFLSRFESGFDIQSAGSNYFLPSTVDIGLSLSYKYRPGIMSSIGLSYKAGWGRDIRHIQVTHQGLGIRLFAEVKLKGNFWFAGGSEMNYLAAFKKIEELKNLPAWRRSALAGLSKKYQFKKARGDIKLLYDFLWTRNGPGGRPFVIRTGYSFK